MKTPHPDMIDIRAASDLLRCNQRTIYKFVDAQLLPPPTNYREASSKKLSRLWPKADVLRLAEARRILKKQV